MPGPGSRDGVHGRLPRLFARKSRGAVKWAVERIDCATVRQTSGARGSEKLRFSDPRAVLWAFPGSMPYAISDAKAGTAQEAEIDADRRPTCSAHSDLSIAPIHTPRSESNVPCTP